MADREHGGAPHTDVLGADRYGEDISGQEHTRVASSGVDLSESTDDGAVSAECAFRACRSTPSRHTGAASLDRRSTGRTSSRAESTSPSSRDVGVAAHRPGGILTDERATDPDDRSPPHAHRDP